MIMQAALDTFAGLQPVGSTLKWCVKIYRHSYIADALFNESINQSSFETQKQLVAQHLHQQGNEERYATRVQIMASGSTRTRSAQRAQRTPSTRLNQAKKRKQGDHFKSDSEDHPVSPEVQQEGRSSSKKRKQAGPYDDLPRPTPAECQVLLLLILNTCTTTMPVTYCVADRQHGTV